MTTCVGFGFGFGDDVACGDVLGEALAPGVVPGMNVADGSGDAVFSCAGLRDGEGDAAGANDGAAANVAVASGSGVKLGAGVGAFTAPAPKNFVSRPPSAKPHKTTRIISGMMGIPPRLGGSGSSRRRRG